MLGKDFYALVQVHSNIHFSVFTLFALHYHPLLLLNAPSNNKNIYICTWVRPQDEYKLIFFRLIYLMDIF